MYFMPLFFLFFLNNWLCLFMFIFFSLNNKFPFCVACFLNFTHNALMYVSLFIDNNFSNVLNDIDVVSKSILLNSSKFLLLISPKWTLFERVKVSMGNGFFLRFGGLQFFSLMFFFGVRGGGVLLLWTLSVFSCNILKFVSLWFFFLSFCGSLVFFSVKFCQGGRGGICLSSCELWSFLFWYFEVPKFSIFFLSFWGFSIFCVKFQKGEDRVFAFLLVSFEGFLF